ncbi:MAG: RNA 2',3'-cyclic phosphodiesterase [Thiobacillaceae bacterium]|nr:RNA 2',3'-cyclic phosphodiesterase [Thiobacillaceae bacterium]
MPDPAPLNDPARVFFALWPDPATRAALDRLAARLHRLRGGRRMRAEGLHLTLLFVGALPRARLAALQAAAAGVCVPAFTLNLDRAECWTHNRIAYASASAPPAALPRLAEDLAHALECAGIAFDRKPFKTHVTLLRNTDCRPADPPITPIVWPVGEFLLMESILRPEGAHYVPLARFALAQGG